MDDVSFSWKKDRHWGLVERADEKYCWYRNYAPAGSDFGELLLRERIFSFKCKNRKKNSVLCKMQIVFQDPYSSLESEEDNQDILSEGYLIHHTVIQKRI